MIARMINKQSSDHISDMHLRVVRQACIHFHLLFKSKRYVYLCFSCISILIYTILMIFSLKASFANRSFSGLLRPDSLVNLIDECMLDDTPCVPNINQALNRYFYPVKKRFPMLLTYRPTIDCDHGRYLLINDALSSHIYHGTGSQLMWYLGVLNVAHTLNLTVIHFEWTSEHTYDEKNIDREKYWQFFEWEIPYAAYAACPQNSSVKQNRLTYDLLPNQTFDQHHAGKQTFTIKSYFKNIFDAFVAKLPRHGSGFTLYSSKTFTITSSLMEVGVVFEIRWWLQHRKDYTDPFGIWTGTPARSNYQPDDYFNYLVDVAEHTEKNITFSKLDNRRESDGSFSPIQCSSINMRNTLLIGVHIRHGDVVKRDSLGRIISGDLYRYIANSAYAPLLILLIQGLPDQLKEKYLITIYSEGNPSDFIDILTELKTVLPESRCRLSFFLNGRTSETFNRLLRDDILIGAFSTFSMAAGILNSRQLKIGPRHNEARVHGMRNHFSVQLDPQHTKFEITAKQQQLIQKRIQYVWKQKREQQQTHSPLWLDNYSSAYPEEFMLI
jgi:hypothetical protein